MSALLDLHHVTSVGVDAKRLIEFYNGVLGMRLLVRTVNPDEPDVLQLYCSAADGAPGSILSFLIHPNAPRGRKGNGQVSGVTLAVPPRSLEYWQRRLARSGASKGQARAFDEAVLCFADPDGLELSFKEDSDDGREVANPHAIRRIQSVELQVDGFEHTARFLEGPFGFNARQTEGAVTRFTNSRLEHPVALDLVCTPSHQPGSDGPGVAHHVTWRVRGRKELSLLRAVLVQCGLDVTPELDRHYFRAVYFRLPDGIRFGLATDGQGLGGADPHGLSLPPWLERRRSALERRHGFAADQKASSRAIDPP